MDEKGFGRGNEKVFHGKFILIDRDYIKITVITSKLLSSKAKGVLFNSVKYLSYHPCIFLFDMYLYVYMLYCMFTFCILEHLTKGGVMYVTVIITNKFWVQG